MVYPLDAGGVNDYPVKVGDMLLTLVDPHKGFEKAYNRWYERDHYFAGCLLGPHWFAGSRWVATRELKGLRFPDGGSVADPVDAGSYVAIYWTEQGKAAEAYEGYGANITKWLYANGRGFAERSHVHTITAKHLGAVYRDADPVPVEVALEHCYPGIVCAFFDGRDGLAAGDLHAGIADGPVRELLDGGPVEIASSWTPHQRETPRQAPMPLGTPSGGPNRLVQVFFVDGDVREAMDRFRRYGEAVEKTGLADTRLVAPFFRTNVGTDDYVDQIW